MVFRWEEAEAKSKHLKKADEHMALKQIIVKQIEFCVFLDYNQQVVWSISDFFFYIFISPSHCVCEHTYLQREKESDK